MKTIIAGSRTIVDIQHVRDAVDQCNWAITEIVSGAAAGVDTLGEQVAAERHIPVTRSPADWKKFGRIAGFLRNTEMAEYSDALIAVWDGKSGGTKHMISEARRLGLRVFVYAPPTTNYQIDDFDF